MTSKTEQVFYSEREREGGVDSVASVEWSAVIVLVSCFLQLAV